MNHLAFNLKLGGIAEDEDDLLPTTTGHYTIKHSPETTRSPRSGSTKKLAKKAEVAKELEQLEFVSLSEDSN